MDLEKHTDLDFPAPLESWSQELRGGVGGKKDVNRVLSPLRLVEVVACRATY